MTPLLLIRPERKTLGILDGAYQEKVAQVAQIAQVAQVAQVAQIAQVAKTVYERWMW